MDFQTNKNMGYAFVNFVRARDAQSFTNLFHGQRALASTSGKVLEITASRRQGIRANVSVFRATALAAMPLPQYKPVVAWQGQLRPLDSDLYNAILTINNSTTITATGEGVSE